MRFLVTGGAGFIGAALANRLVREGHQVRVLDDLSAGDPSRLDPRVLFTRGDVRDVPKLWTLLQGVHCVYHLAARVSVPESILYPRDYNDVNVGGTVSVMEAVRDARVKRVVLGSSGAVYGEQAEQPVSEKATLNPRSPYAVSKIAAEYYVSTIGDLYGIETVILRIFNTYGPGQFVPASHAPVIPQFLKQALSGGSLVVFGDGNQTRDFVYIDDVVDALVAAATARNVNRCIINVGSGQEVSINELVEKVARATGRDITPLYSPAESGGVSRLVADISLARRKLGFSPKVDLDKGLRLTLALDPQFKSMAKPR
ncbi:MAG TPA: NAD-dependent epimerase/dehydratase family protein [Anaerolineae bacterium]|nr:NAD-dependent epimerase/dehydratase family protein [Anaerolineae bacterium]